MNRINPFEELYVSETVDPASFVKLFSDRLVPFSLAVFQPGNVVVLGLQGSGKTTLLSLLRPSIRLAYALADAPFPVPEQHRRFIGCGINLKRSNAIAFGQRPILQDPAENQEKLPIYFGDFLNYWIVDDLLRSVEQLCCEADGVVGSELGLDLRPQIVNAAARRLARADEWFGGLGGVGDFTQLKRRIKDRIGSYFSFLNFNTDSLPVDLSETKTLVGAPIARTVGCLREAGVIPDDVHVFAQIDQYEELGQLVGAGSLGEIFRQMLNRAIATRDARLSFRIGSRKWAWRQDLRVLGSHQLLEEYRDFNVVDLDRILRRPENRVTWVFPDFAEDITRRRLEAAGIRIAPPGRPILKRLLGPRLTPDVRARMYSRAKEGPADSLTGPEKPVATEWFVALKRYAEEFPFRGRLIAAAKLQEKEGVDFTTPESAWRVLSGRTCAYWVKERREVALLQVAAAFRQRPIWAGEDEVLQLSGGNILTFVSIMRQIWVALLRSRRDHGPMSVYDAPIEPINTAVQTLGIEDASLLWFRKIPEQPEGHVRQRFVRNVGTRLRGELLKMDRLSNPGWTGFSVANNELASIEGLDQWLHAASDFGDLVELAHTTKERDRRPRTKYYFQPILSPYLGLPSQRTKEPMYVGAFEVSEWIAAAQSGAGESIPLRGNQAQSQLSLLE